MKLSLSPLGARSFELFASLVFALSPPALATPSAPSASDPPPPQALSPDASHGDGEPDALCLTWLTKHEVMFKEAKSTRGIRTPIEIPGPIKSVLLTPQSHRPALMDCELARALDEAEPVFKELGITELVYSAAYDYRNRRGSSQLSGHAHGLAIDVHVIGGPTGKLHVEQGFEKGVGEWLGLPRVGASLEACIGEPLTEAGRRLRTLACRLKLHPAFRVIVTRDDNEEHRDHFHLESYPDLPSRTRKNHLVSHAPHPVPPGNTTTGATPPPLPDSARASSESRTSMKRARKKHPKRGTHKQKDKHPAHPAHRRSQRVRDPKR